MKRIIYFLCAIAIATLTSCSDDNDLAQVDVNIEISGITVVDNVLYTIEGENVTLENTTVNSLTAQPAIIQRVAYSLDYTLLLPEFGKPFTASFSTEGLRIGKHLLGMEGVILQVDKTLTPIRTQLPLIIVEKKEDLPENAPEIGTYTITIDGL